MALSLLLVCWGKGCLMCRCHGNCGHNAGTHFLRTTRLDPLIRPAALSTHLRRHDRSCCYFWLLLAISVVCFFCCCTFCVLFSFFISSFFFPLPPLPPCHWSLSVFEVHWTKSLWRTEGFSASLALEQGLFLPVTSRGPRCVAGQSSCVPSSQVAVNLRKVQVCCLFFSQPGAAKEQVAMSGDLLGQ